MKYFKVCTILKGCVVSYDMINHIFLFHFSKI